MMAFEGLLSGRDLILRHTNAIRELPSKGLKEYCPNNSWLEKKQLENRLEEKFSFIQAERIEKSNNISQAEWINDLKKARLTKKIGKLWETFGHHCDNEDWLFPEETLFLVENCELQVFYNTISIGIEDLYRLVFDEGGYSLDNYRVFSLLNRAGLKVVRHCPSISATEYEKQVRLDAVMQMQKRSPPYPIAEENVTIVDDDIVIVESVSNKDTRKKGAQIPDGSAENPIVIDIEDEPEENRDVLEITIIDSDSDSDVVCVSSPKFICDKDLRLWYPPIQKCLLNSTDILIDLSDDTDDVDNKSVIRSKIDLIRTSKDKILSCLPSVKSGVSVIQVPDNRLLPTNIVPKYSEYKVNLNIRPDESNVDYSNRNNYLGNSLSNYNNFRLSPDVVNNPFYQKAQEMHALAVNMIRNAAHLMSCARQSDVSINEPVNYNNGFQAIAEQNPNELWDLMQASGSRITSFSPTIPGINYVRPRNLFPRRRFFRRRPRGYFPGRRRPYRTIAHGNVKQENGGMFDSTSSLEPSHSLVDEILILSDDEEFNNRANNFETHNTKKRKVNNAQELFKRLKTEPDSDIILSSGDSCVLENDSDTDINIKKELSDRPIKEETNKTAQVESGPSNIKSESNLAIVKCDVSSPITNTDSIFSDVNSESSLLNIKAEPSSAFFISNESSLAVENSRSNTISIKSEPRSATVNFDSNLCEISSEAHDIQIKSESSSKNTVPELVPEGQNSFSIVENMQKNDLNLHGDSDPSTKIVTDQEPQSKDKLKERLSQRTDLVSKRIEEPLISSTINSEPSTSEVANLNIQNQKYLDENISEKGHDGDQQLNNAVKNNLFQNSSNDELTSWKQYLNKVDDFDTGEELNPVHKFEHCYTYGDVLTALQIFKKIEVNRVSRKFKISFDVYLPESNFKKSLKVLPNYRVIIMMSHEELPSSLEIENLKSDYQDSIPFLFSVVFDETIAFYLYDTVSVNQFYQ